MITCTRCGEIKPFEDFPWKNKSEGKRHKKCKKCGRADGLAHYQENKEKYKASSKKNGEVYRERNRGFILDYLRNHPCVDCGEQDIEVLEFDHIEMHPDKRVWSLLKCSLKAVKEEISRCEVRCANCHTRRTRRQMGWTR